jgi:translation initiation factor 2B subunit (eIF-2B alpha/beta/delta family)
MHSTEDKLAQALKLIWMEYQYSYQEETDRHLDPIMDTLINTLPANFTSTNVIDIALTILEDKSKSEK